MVSEERFRCNELDPEFEAEGWLDEWLPIIDDVFTPLIDDEGSFLHYPYEGSLMNQPHKLMEVLRVIQCSYKRVKYERVQSRML